MLPPNELSVLPLTAPNPVFGSELVRPPNPEEPFARLPKPDALNLSSDVCADGAVSLDARGLGDMEAKGDTAEVFAKPLVGGILVLLEACVESCNRLPTLVVDADSFTAG